MTYDDWKTTPPGQDEYPIECPECDTPLDDNGECPACGWGAFGGDDHDTLEEAEMDR